LGLRNANEILERGENSTENLKSGLCRDNIDLNIGRDLDKGSVSFSIGEVLLSFALYFVLKAAFGNDFFLQGYLIGMAISSLLGFLLLGYGLKITIQEAKQLTT
jgi:hypothetical protein